MSLTKFHIMEMLNLTKTYLAKRIVLIESIQSDAKVVALETNTNISEL